MEVCKLEGKRGLGLRIVSSPRRRRDMRTLSKGSRRMEWKGRREVERNTTPQGPPRAKMGWPALLLWRAEGGLGWSFERGMQVALAEHAHQAPSTQHAHTQRHRDPPPGKFQFHCLPIQSHISRTRTTIAPPRGTCHDLIKTPIYQHRPTFYPYGFHPRHFFLCT